MDERRLEKSLKAFVRTKPFPPLEKMSDNALKRRKDTLDDLVADLVKAQKAIKNSSKSPENKKLADDIAATERAIARVEEEQKRRKKAGG